MYQGATSAVKSIDYSPLRRKLRVLIGGLKDHATHDRLPELCEQVNIPRQSRGLYDVSRSKRLERGR